MKRSEAEEQWDPRYKDFDFTGFFDGACTRTKCAYPLGTYGCVVYDRQGNIIREVSGPVESDSPTNNVSEAYGLLTLLRTLIDLGAQKYTRVQIVGDSELILKQVKGIYRINSNAIRIV